MTTYTMDRTKYAWNLNTIGVLRVVYFPNIVLGWHTGVLEAGDSNISQFHYTKHEQIWIQYKTH